MKQKKMSIIDATFEKHKKLVLEHLNTKKKLLNENINAKFVTNVTIDPKKMGKNFPLQADVEVKVEVQGAYADNSFDYEHGSVHGTHDPGSGFEVGEIEITAPEAIYVFDENGNQTDQLLFNAGGKIKKEFILPDDLKNIYDEASSKLDGAARDYEG
jgi:hypothetical protein